MRVLIKSCESLSAVVRALARAKELNEQGHTVLVAALPRFHDFFRCVGYCKPANPFVTPYGIDQTFDLDGEPYDPPPLSEGPWFDNTNYRIDGRPIVSVYGAGWDPDCDMTPEQVMAAAEEKLSGRDFYILTQDQNYWGDGIHVCPLRLRDLPGLIAHTSEFLSPESTALHIAYSVRPLSSTYRLTNEVLLGS